MEGYRRTNTFLLNIVCQNFFLLNSFSFQNSVLSRTRTSFEDFLLFFRTFLFSSFLFFSTSILGSSILVNSIQNFSKISLYTHKKGIEFSLLFGLFTQSEQCGNNNSLFYVLPFFFSFGFQRTILCKYHTGYT